MHVDEQRRSLPAAPHGVRGSGAATLSGPGPYCAAPPGGPPKPGGPGGGSDREREGGVATRSRPKVARPKRFKVVLYNDDYTPMEFVVSLLEQVFEKSPAAATALMLQIHRGGSGVAGVYVLEIAETKVAAVHRLAEEHGYPLRAGAEEE